MKKEEKTYIRKATEQLGKALLMVGFIYLIYSTDAISVDYESLAETTLHINHGLIFMSIGCMVKIFLNVGDCIYGNVKTRG